jgi:pSer/pThr/pTyr-binding forkhead associated (FHA) protein
VQQQKRPFVPRTRFIPIILSLLFGLTLSVPVVAQGEGARLFITEVQTSEFPDVSFNLFAVDLENRIITDYTNLVLQEDQRTISDFDTDSLDVGTDLFIVLDADSTIEQIDEEGGQTRREKVRDSIIRYANFFMDPMQLDRVTLIVPEGQDARILDNPGLSFPNEVINAVNFYETGELSEPALDLLMQVALDQAALSKEEGRSQAILLFTDAGQLDEQLDLDLWAEAAQEAGITAYVAILGTRADSDEIAHAARLVEPSGGTFAHMPEPLRVDDLYSNIQSRAERLRVSYRSKLNEAGSHTLSAQLDGAQSDEIIELLIEPPEVALAVDNSRPIRRVAAQPDTPIDQMEPTHQPLVAQVSWPDKHPRNLESSVLLLNGTEMPVENAILGDDGLLTFDWDIRFLEEGIYNVQVQVIDELELSTSSDPLPLEIIIDRPGVLPSPPPTTEPALVVTVVPEPEPDTSPVNTLLIAGGVGLFLVFLVILIIVFVLLRRRNRSAPTSVGQNEEPIASPSNIQIQPTDSPRNFEPGVTYIQPPGFDPEGQIEAFLEVLEHAQEHESMIPLSGNNISLGRDAKRSQIVFQDRSVSRLHARIIKSQDSYRIYDEGSSSGTYVNYEKLGLSPQPLNDQDRIHLGRVHLRFRRS